MNKIWKVITGLVTVVVMSAIFVGCSLISPVSEDQLDKPTDVVCLDDVVTWTRGRLYESTYRVYANEEQVAEVKVDDLSKSTFSYTFTDKISVPQQIQVRAIKVDKEKYNSELSTAVIRYANTYSEDAIMEVDLAEESNFTLTIESDIRRVYIEGDSSLTYANSYILVKERSLPLEIELKNVLATAPANKSLIYTEGTIGEATSNEPYVTIISSGAANSLKGGNCTTVPAKPATGGIFAKGGQGKSGGAGYPAISLTKLLVKGSVALTLTGGNGGVGGEGGNGNLNSGGEGGTGGAGGNAANFAILQLKMGSGSIDFVGGVGGNGGQPGSGTGDWLTGGGVGSKGAAGKDYTGTVKIISGVVKE